MTNKIVTGKSDIRFIRRQRRRLRELIGRESPKYSPTSTKESVAVTRKMRTMRRKSEISALRRMKPPNLFACLISMKETYLRKTKRSKCTSSESVGTTRSTFGQMTKLRR